MSEARIYTRAMPEAWPELVDRAQWLLEGSAMPAHVTTEHAAAMYAATQRLDNEPLVANRYYGLGKALCPFAEALKRPSDGHELSVRDRVIQQAASGLATGKPASAESSELAALVPHGILIDEIADEGGAMHWPFFNLASKTTPSLPLAERLVVSTLTELTDERVAQRSDLYRDLLTDEVVAESVLLERLKRIAAMDNIESNIGAAALGGLSLLTSAALLIKARSNNRRLPIVDIVGDQAGLERLIPVKAAASAAGLHLSEITDSAHMRHALRLGPDGAVSVDWKNFSGPPVLPILNELHPFIHLERPGCPAIQVKTLIASVVGMFPEIIWRADAMRKGA